MSSEPHCGFTLHELEVMQCLVRGLTDREIADYIGLTQTTVKFYLWRISEKLGVSTRAALLLAAQRLRSPEDPN